MRIHSFTHPARSTSIHSLIHHIALRKARENDEDDDVCIQRGWMGSWGHSRSGASQSNQAKVKANNSKAAEWLWFFGLLFLMENLLVIYWWLWLDGISPRQAKTDTKANEVPAHPFQVALAHLFIVFGFLQEHEHNTKVFLVTSLTFYIHWDTKDMVDCFVILLFPPVFDYDYETFEHSSCQVCFADVVRGISSINIFLSRILKKRRENFSLCWFGIPIVNDMW